MVRPSKFEQCFFFVGSWDVGGRKSASRLFCLFACLRVQMLFSSPKQSDVYEGINKLAIPEGRPSRGTVVERKGVFCPETDED